MTRAEWIAVLLETSLAMSAAVVAVLLVRRPLRRWFGAGVAYSAWWIVPATMLAGHLPVSSHAVSPLAQGYWSLDIAGAARVDTAATMTANGGTWTIAMWLLGTVAAGAWMARRQRRFRASLGRLVVHRDGCLRSQCDVGLPAVIGLWRPAIVLPPDFEHRYDSQQRELILAHERVHLARGDLRLNALVAVVRCVFWFNPLLHYAAARFRHDQELSCDARVIARHPGARRAYAQAMFTTQLAAQATPLGCHWGHPHPLQERIQMLKRNTSTPLRRRVGIVAVTALACAAGAVAWAAQPAPPASAATPGTVMMEFVAEAGGHERRFTQIEPVGQAFSIRDAGGDARWTIDGVATVGEDKALYTASTRDTVWLAMTLRKDGEVVGTPKIAVKSGGTARVSHGGKPGAGRADLELQIKLTAAQALSAQSTAAR
ncbi:M56 family metallopeptidase [Lysobacter sp. CA199]|uniref:M56 family metallopeptidase n=1 Tax=Lysobacter sp. CA199 TaxID=3455608 RepID=UPI003F8CFCD5